MNRRAASLARLRSEDFDVLIAGAGINGAASAAALAARGLKVALVDRGDFAGQTSSASSNLVWGGIKYLESYEFGLVRGLCLSRNRLMNHYPDNVREMRFYALHTRDFRHGGAALRLGTWAYWMMGSGRTQPPRALSLGRLMHEEPAVSLEGLRGGVEYSDACLPEGDARFVLGLIRAALGFGAVAANYVEVLSVRREGGLWLARLRRRDAEEEFPLRARLLVNACGPYAEAFNLAGGLPFRHRHLFSKGVHLVLPKLLSGRRILAFPASDGRPFFLMPLGQRTVAGTTDTPLDSPEAAVNEEDRRFILEQVNRRLRLPEPLGPRDIIAERCGVRPLAVAADGPQGSGDWLHLSRRHVFEEHPALGLLAVYGGKISDCLNIGEEALRATARALPQGPALTGPRWFGEPGSGERQDFLRRAMETLARGPCPSPPRKAAERLWRRYGSEASALLRLMEADPASGTEAIPGSGVLLAEADHAATAEMVVRPEDFLRRRTNLALEYKAGELEASPGYGALLKRLGV